MIKLLEKIDLFGTEVQLKYKNQIKISTNTSKFITIFFYLAACSSIIFFIIQFSNKTNPKINKSTKYLPRNYTK